MVRKPMPNAGPVRPVPARNSVPVWSGDERSLVANRGIASARTVVESHLQAYGAQESPETASI